MEYGFVLVRNVGLAWFALVAFEVSCHLNMMFKFLATSLTTVAKFVTVAVLVCTNIPYIGVSIHAIFPRRLVDYTGMCKHMFL